MKKSVSIIIIIGLFIGLASCVTPRPDNIENICSIFHQYPKWYWTANKTAHKWGVPVAVQMAIIYQESRFKATAKPPHERLLGIIPWFGRKSSSYGYTQALRSTWRRYERSTGNYGKRDSFAAASDFIGWYAYLMHRRLGIPRNNAYAIYLAYHEGINGYRYKTYLHKHGLIMIARRVEHRARVYQWQLNRCRSSIKKRHWWNIF